MKHENYGILNLIGYGLAKFNNEFIKQFGFDKKIHFLNYCVSLGIAETASVVKNRMDLFDPFFDNGRSGWHQKGDAYIHRKILIDNLFGNENVQDFANIIKLFLKQNYNIDFHESFNIQPILKSKFQKLQETGLEAEIYFINNYTKIQSFENASLEDARLLGDGYDFQVNLGGNFILSEIKGIREKKGTFRMTQKEYNKALEYKDDYSIILVMNLNEKPYFLNIKNPTKNLKFKKQEVFSKSVIEYHLINNIC